MLYPCRVSARADDDMKPRFTQGHTATATVNIEYVLLDPARQEAATSCSSNHPRAIYS